MCTVPAASLPLPGLPYQHAKALRCRRGLVVKVSRLGRERSVIERAQLAMRGYVSLCPPATADMQACVVWSFQAVLEAPPAPKPAVLSEKHLKLLQQYKGPLVKIATHYHVGFGDCLRVIGSSEELGAWKAADAPLMRWNEGDVWTLVTPLPPGEHEFKVRKQQLPPCLCLGQQWHVK